MLQRRLNQRRCQNVTFQPPYLYAEKLKIFHFNYVEDDVLAV